MIDVGKYDHWHDPIYIKWEREQRAEEVKQAEANFAKKAKEYEEGKNHFADAYAKGFVNSTDYWANHNSKDDFFYRSLKAASDNLGKAQDASPRNPNNSFEALWQPLKANALPNSEAIAFTVKTGGAVTITPQSVTIDGAANKDQATIETAVLHAKTQWGGKMQIDSGTEEFKARAWAAAQLHGVKVHGYKPTKEARELAKTITSYRQSQPVQQYQPEQPRVRPVVQHVRAPAYA